MYDYSGNHQSFDCLTDPTIIMHYKIDSQKYKGGDREGIQPTACKCKMSNYRMNLNALNGGSFLVLIGTHHFPMIPYSYESVTAIICYYPYYV